MPEKQVHVIHPSQLNVLSVSYTDIHFAISSSNQTENQVVFIYHSLPNILKKTQNSPNLQRTLLKMHI